MMRLKILFVMLASLLLAAPAAHAQTADPSIADLSRRMDALERENRDLRSALIQQPHAMAMSVDPLGHHRTGDHTGDESRIRSIVEDCLADRGLQHASAESWVEAPAHHADASPGTAIGQDLAMSATWRNGLELTTQDKSQRIHIGGRWQFDTSWFSADQAVQNNLPGDVRYHDGVDFRRARLRIDGTMYEVIEYAMEYDFVNGSRVRNAANTNFTDFDVTALTDMWLQFSHTPVGHIRVGNQKEAIGFEHLVSSRFLPFMERSYNQDTFYGGTFNGFTPGASVSSNIWEDRASYNIGLYKPTNNVFGFNTNDGDYAVTGRLTWLPIYEEEGRQLVHLGISAREATTYNGLVLYRTRDAVRAGVSTQWPLPASVLARGDRMTWLNMEFCALQGPWTLQAEWLTNFTSNGRATTGAGTGVGPRVDSLFYQGGYVQLLYFLTGESDTYSLERMALDRMKPFENYFWVRGEDGHLFGRGAWQLGARYNYLDLNDQDINGGILHNFTTGVNWFFNPNTKWQFNYIATYRDVSQTANFPDGSGWIHGWACGSLRTFKVDVMKTVLVGLFVAFYLLANVTAFAGDGLPPWIAHTEQAPCNTCVTHSCQLVPDVKQIKKTVYEVQEVPYCLKKLPPLLSLFHPHDCNCEQCAECQCVRYKKVLVKKEVVCGEICTTKCIPQEHHVPCQPCQPCGK